MHTLLGGGGGCSGGDGGGGGGSEYLGLAIPIGNVFSLSFLSKWLFHSEKQTSTSLIQPKYSHYYIFYVLRAII